MVVVFIMIVWSDMGVFLMSNRRILCSSEMIKAILLNCNVVLDYCRESNLDIQKLRNADVIDLPDMFAFTRPSDFKLPKGAIGLEYDIATQPKPLLGVDIARDGSLSIITTEYTKELIRYDDIEGSM